MELTQYYGCSYLMITYFKNHSTSQIYTKDVRYRIDFFKEVTTMWT